MEKVYPGNPCLRNRVEVGGHPFHVQDIVHAVLEDRDPYVGPVEAMKALRIILAVYESAKNGGKEVVID